jgi:glutamate dehydrogenase (NAD(P)+)
MKSATGKPKSMGGLPHELGSTGFGVHHAIHVAAEALGMDLSSSSVAIEGFGNVATFVAKHLKEDNAKIVAVSDSRGTIYNRNGLDLDRLSEVKLKTGSVVNYRPGKVLPNMDIISVPADILVPAAVPDLIRPSEVKRVKARLIVEGSNIPMKPSTEGMFHKKGVLVVPDFVANSGGVISSYVEYIGGTEKDMFRMVEDKITKNTRMVLGRSREKGIPPREAALDISRERVMKKM